MGKMIELTAGDGHKLPPTAPSPRASRAAP